MNLTGFINYEVCDWEFRNIICAGNHICDHLLGHFTKFVIRIPPYLLRDSFTEWTIIYKDQFSCYVNKYANTLETRITDTLLTLTPSHYGQFSLSPRNASTFFSKFNPLNTDTRLKWGSKDICCLSSLSQPRKCGPASLSTMYCTLWTFWKVKNPSVDSMSMFLGLQWRILRSFVDLNFRLFWHQTSYAENGFN